MITILAKIEFVRTVIKSDSELLTGMVILIANVITIVVLK